MESLKIKNFLFFSLKEDFLNKSAKEKASYTFPYKEATFSTLKYFLIILIKSFFLFYNNFLYTRQSFAFHFLRDFCNVPDHICYRHCVGETE